MQYEIDKAAFENLSDDLKNEYSENGGAYFLKIEGDNAPTQEKIDALEQKRRLEIEHREKAEKREKEASDRAEKFQRDLEKASGKEEIEKLKQDHSAEIERIRAEREQEKAQAKLERDARLISEEASKLAGKFTIPSLVKDQFVKRLHVEEPNGQPVVRVLDADGKPSTHSIEDLSKEFLDNPEFKSIVKADSGSGGGATNPGSGGSDTITKLSDFKNATEEAKFANEHPEQYQQMQAG